MFWKLLSNVSIVKKLINSLCNCIMIPYYSWNATCSICWITFQEWRLCMLVPSQQELLRPKPSSNILLSFLSAWLYTCILVWDKICFSVFNSKVKLILSSVSIFDACMVFFWPHKVWRTWIVLWQCSASCGKGDRARYVSCRDAHGGIADESFCAHLPRPAEVSSCFSPCGEWQVGNWSPVSITWNGFLFVSS